MSRFNQSAGTRRYLYRWQELPDFQFDLICGSLQSTPETFLTKFTVTAIQEGRGMWQSVKSIWHDRSFHPYQPSSHSCSKVRICSSLRNTNVQQCTKKCDHVENSTLKSEVVVTTAPIISIPCATRDGHRVSLSISQFLKIICEWEGVNAGLVVKDILIREIVWTISTGLLSKLCTATARVGLLNDYATRRRWLANTLFCLCNLFIFRVIWCYETFAPSWSLPYKVWWFQTAVYRFLTTNLTLP